MGKRVLTFFLCAALCVTCVGVFAGCADETPTETYTVTLDKAEMQMILGESANLKATVKDKDGKEVTDQTVTWASDNTEVATVTKYGGVLAKKIGTCKITAAVGDNKATCDVQVKAEVAITQEKGISTLLVPEADNEAIAAFTTVQLSANCTPKLETGEKLTWASSATGVATVSAEGLVTAVAAGTAKITATAPNGAVGEYNITVEARNTEATTLTFEVDIADGLKSIGLTELPEYAGLYVVGDAFGWNDKLSEDQRLQPKEGSKTVFVATIEIDANAEDFTARSSGYKYLLASPKLDGSGYVSQLGWESVNGSPVDNRSMFINNDMTVKDTVTVFQGKPGNPNRATGVYTITINLTVEGTAPETLVLAGALPGAEWSETGGADGQYIFEKQADNTYKLTFTATTNAAGFECKLTSGAWDPAWGAKSIYENGVALGDTDGNVMMALPEVGADNEAKEVTINWTLKIA